MARGKKHTKIVGGKKHRKGGRKRGRKHGRGKR